MDRIFSNKRDLLAACKEKLQLYRAQHSGEYIGGVEYTALITAIDAALDTPAPFEFRVRDTNGEVLLRGRCVQEDGRSSFTFEPGVVLRNGETLELGDLTVPT